VKDLYEILGVAKDADAKTIQSAFRRLAKQHHPDVNQGNTEAEEKFKEISHAYNILSDPERRRHYDIGGGEEQPRYNNGAYDHFAHFGGFQHATYHTFFDEYGNFHRINEPRKNSPNTDIEATLLLDPSESFKERSTQLQYQRLKYCEECNGEGGGGGHQQCPDCKGRKYIQQQINQFTSVTVPCNRCQQRGSIFNEVCGVCNGFGMKEETATYTVKVPVGSYFKKLRVAGGGHQTNPKYPAGDLLIVLMPPTPYKEFQFTNDGTVYIEMLLDPIEALVGVEKKVKDIKGENVTFKVPAGSREKQIIRLENHGLMTSETERGVFAAILKYDNTISLTEEQKGILQSYLDTKKEKEATK